MNCEQELKKVELKNCIKLENEQIGKIEKSIGRMLQETDELAYRAQKEKKVTLIAESNALRKRAEQFKCSLERTAEKVKKMETEMKAMVF